MICLVSNVSISVSVVVCVPFAVFHGLIKKNRQATGLAGSGVLCREMWPSQEAGKVATVAVVTITYVIPMSIIIFCYTRMIRHLWRQSTVTHPAQVSRYYRL